MTVCSFCRSTDICDCYFDKCPTCEKVINMGRPCDKCRLFLSNKKTVTTRCKKCMRDSTFVVCVMCKKNPAYFCIDCYDNNRRSKGKFYSYCAECF